MKAWDHFVYGYRHNLKGIILLGSLARYQKYIPCMVCREVDEIKKKKVLKGGNPGFKGQMVNILFHIRILDSTL